MTRVLEVMAGAAHGGAEAFFERLVGALHEAGLDQRVVMRPGDGREARLAALGLPVSAAPFGPWFDWRTRRVLAREIADHQPDVVLAWMSRAAQMCPHPGRGRALVGRLGGFYHLKYFRRCDHLVGNTRHIVDWLAAQGWPRARLTYLPNFVDVTPAPPIPRAQLATPDEAKVILALGRFHDDKAFDVLLPALAQVPDAILWLGGEGPREGDLRAQAARLGVAARVRWLGWRRDVAALSAAADVLCCPSRVEPLGNVVLEAWGHGLPVVAAAATGPAELIEDGRTGLLAPLEDADALARALKRVLSNPGLSSDLAEAGARHLAETFSRARVVAAFQDFFETVRRQCAA